jgi:hypothetical protein
MPIVFMVIIGRTLFLTLKYGVVVGGKWGERIYKKEQPVYYWFMVVCFAAIFIISLCLLIILVRYDFLLAKWPKPPN